MSEVRMCDVVRSPGCQGIFSVLADGWQRFTGSTVKQTEDGPKTIQTTMDICPECAFFASRNVKTITAE
jgi:hypothetical protein